MISFGTGTDVLGCGCVGLIDDQSLEGSEIFSISATINDPILMSTGSLSTSVIISDLDSEYIAII